MTAGTLYFGMRTLTVTGDADFSMIGGIAKDPGAALELAGSGTHTFQPKPGAVFPLVKFTGSGATTIGSHSLSADSILITNGAVNLGSAFGGHYTGKISATGGTLNFNACTLSVSMAPGIADLSGLENIDPGTGKLKFTWTGGTSQFIPKSGATHPRISVDVSGGSTFNLMGSLIAHELRIGYGTVNLGSGTHIFDSLTSWMNMATLNFGTSVVEITGGKADFQGIGVINRQDGILSFNGSSGTQILKADDWDTLPQIEMIGSDTVELGSNITADSLIISNGTFLMPGAYRATFRGLVSTTPGGAIDIGMDTLFIDGDADFSGLAALNTSMGGVCVKASRHSKHTLFNHGGKNFRNLTLWVCSDPGAGDTMVVAGGELKVSQKTKFRWNKVSNPASTAVWRFDTHDPSLFLAGDIQHEMLGSGPNKSILFMGDGDWVCSSNVNLAMDTLHGNGSTLRMVRSLGGSQTLAAAPGLNIIEHAGTDTLILGSNIVCHAFKQTAGTFAFNGRQIMCSGGPATFAIDGGKISAMMTDTIIADTAVFLRGSAGDSLTIMGLTIIAPSTGVVEAEFAKLSYCIVSGGAIGTAYFSQNVIGNTNWMFSNAKVWTGGGGNNYWATPENWIGNTAPTGSDSVVFSGRSVKPCVLNAPASAKAVTFTSAYPGDFNFNGNNLEITGAADFRSGGTFQYNGGDTIKLTGTGAQYVYGHVTDTLPFIHHQGSSTAHFTVPCKATGLKASSSIDASATSVELIGDILLEAGTFSAPASTLTVGGSWNNANAGFTHNNGKIVFTTITPSAALSPGGQAFNNVAFAGQQPLTITGELQANRVEIQGGAVNLGTGLTHTITKLLSSGGGSLNFGSSTLQISGDSADFSGLASITAGDGSVLALNDTGSLVLIPPAGQALPAIVKSQSGTVTVVNNGLQAAALSVAGGTWHWGNQQLSHGVSGSIAYGSGTGTGIMNFGNAGVVVTVSQNVNLSGYADVMPGNGTLVFNGTGIQQFDPHGGALHPSIQHTGSGTLKLNGSSLTANSFTQTAGTLDLSGLNITVSGDFVIDNGTPSTILNLGGCTIQSTTGNIRLNGQSDSLLNLNPSTTWYLKASYGNATATYATVARSDASMGHTVQATNCVDSGGNSNWNFGPPVSAITSPAKNAKLNTAPSSISGTASVSGGSITSVSVSICRLDGAMAQFWNGSTWGGTPMWLTASGTTTWAYSTSAVSWTDGAYIIASKARDNFNQEQTRPDSTKFTLDRTAPVITVSLPKSPDTVNTAAVSYSLSESVASAAVTWTRTAGSADARSPHTVTLSGNALAAGDHANVTPATALPLVDRAVYTVTFSATDSAGNASTPVAVAGVVFKATAQPPVLYAPITFGTDDSSFALDFLIPEPALQGSVKLTIAESGGGRQHVATFDSVFEAGGRFALTLNGRNISTTPGVVAVSSDPGDSLVNGMLYNVIIAYQDKKGNPAVADTSRNVMYQNADVTPPEFRFAAGTGCTVVGDSAVVVRFKAVDTTIFTDAKYIVAYYKHSSVSGTDSVSTNRVWLPYRDTTIVVRTVKQGAWIFGSALADAAKNRTAFYDTVITIANTAPVITTTDSFTVYEDSVWAYALSARDLNGDPIAFSVTSMPAAMTYTASTALLRWTPVNEEVGRHTLTVTASDGQGGTAAKTMTITVVNTNDAPKITSVTLPDTVVENSLITALTIVSDIDAGDSVRIILSPNLAWLAVPSSEPVSTAGSDRQFTLVGTPGDKDTGLIVYWIIARDRAGAADTLRRTIYVVNTNDPPETAIQTKKRAFGAAQYVIKGRDDFDTLLTYVASIGAVGPATPATFTNTTGLFTFSPLLDGLYAFACYAVDSKGLADSTPVCDTFVVAGATRKVFADTGAWAMMGVPSGAYPADSLKAGAVMSYWDESANKRGIYEYYIDGGNIRQLSAGQAYWRKSPRPLTVALSQFQLVTVPCTLNLKKTAYGWNQITSPYPYPVKWSRPGALWKWDAALKDYTAVTDSSLDPWQGYWYMTDTAAAAVINPVPYFAPSALSKQAKTFFVDKTHWQVQISLVSGRGQDAENIIGYNPAALNGFDPHDRPEPPPLPGRPYMFIAHPEWKRGVSKYASDIRRTVQAEADIFQVGVTGADAAAGPVTFHARGVKNLSDIYLFIAGPERVGQLSDDSVYSVTPGNETVYQTVFATRDKDFLRKFPYAFHAGVPYPNPFAARVNLRYTLPYRWEKNGWLNTEPYEVRMDIFDARGRLVRSLVDRRQEPGHYIVVWDGKGNTGRQTAAGTYFCVLKAAKFSATNRVVVIR